MTASTCGFQIPYRTAWPERTDFWRSRPPSAIVDEIDLVVRRTGVRRFLFDAFVFFGHGDEGRAVVEEVARGILRRRLDISFRIVSHPSGILRNQALLPLLRQAGLERIYVGLDSGLDRLLRLYRVDFTTEDSLAALRCLSDLQIAFDLGFFFFDPRLRFKEIPEIFTFLRRLERSVHHQRMPFSYYLDRQLLHSRLPVTVDMPLIHELVRDGLAEILDPLAGTIDVRFADRQVAKLFRLQHLVSTELLRPLRSLLYDPARASSVPEGACFPLRVAEETWRAAAACDGDEENALQQAMQDLRQWFRDPPRSSGLTAQPLHSPHSRHRVDLDRPQGRHETRDNSHQREQSPHDDVRGQMQ